jgi:hypothetical protein
MHLCKDRDTSLHPQEHKWKENEIFILQNVYSLKLTACVLKH